MNMDNLSGLDKAATLFQVLGESLALSMFQSISKADILRIRVRSRELRNIPVSLKQNILALESRHRNENKENEKLQQKLWRLSYLNTIVL